MATLLFVQSLGFPLHGEHETVIENRGVTRKPEEFFMRIWVCEIFSANVFTGI